jgi:molybdopterin synthase catalytic subunit
MDVPELSIIVQAASFDAGAELNAFQLGRTDAGAVAAFSGLVRDHNQGSGVSGLYLEHYPGMTEAVLRDICSQAAERWNLLAARVIHRHGTLLPGESIVLVLCAAAHRGEAFDACAFIMDRLKTDAPFWKRESTSDGERWVEARAADLDAARRWTMKHE